MSSYRSRKPNPSSLKKMEEGFQYSWNKSPKSLQYNPFEDKHNVPFFKLPVIQSHLKKLKRRIRKEPGWAENNQLVKEISKKLEQEKKEKSSDIPTNLKVYIDGDIVDCNKSKYNKTDGVAEKSGRYRKTELRGLFKNSDLTKVISPGRTKTEAKGSQSINKSVNHQSLVQYIRRKKQQVSDSPELPAQNPHKQFEQLGNG